MPATLRFLWLIGCSCNLCLCCRWCVLSSSHKDTNHWIHHPNSSACSHPNLIISAKTLFSNKVTFTDMWWLQHILCEDTIQPTVTILRAISWFAKIRFMLFLTASSQDFFWCSFYLFHSIVFQLLPAEFQATDPSLGNRQEVHGSNKNS